MYTNAYIWNLERWLRLIHLQGSNGETDTENRLIDTGRGEERQGEMYGESNMEIYNTICKIRQPMGICCRTHKQGLCNNLEGWDKEGDERQFGREGTWVHL